ncbi:MAG TPA: pilus assembly PilX N-terminal domain-containing protein [Baekduia sp.]|nr:pilus assembly PilX N-terminal domain-containing protein [Baekduia sp.]
MIPTRFKQEDGVALVVAVILMAMMLSLALIAINLADGQARTTAQQRQRESAFNVAEAALNAQVTQLSQHWADISGTGTGACPGATYCPTTAELTGLIPSADANVAVTWKTNVYDDSAALDGFFADSRISNQPSWDANGDGKVWVRAEAQVRGHTRVLVSLVQKQTQLESVPHAAIVAGALTIENNGQHSDPIIDANGGLIAVRCPVVDGEADPCLGQPLGKAPTKDPAQWSALLTNQINGFSSAQTGYPAASLFTQDQIYRFIATAKAGGTYYTSCPSTLAGAVVVVDMTGDCSYTGSVTWNTQPDPGFVIFLRATSTLKLGGTTTYNGIIYHANMGNPPILSSATQSSASLIMTSGNTLINGGVIIDGPGRMDAGESGMNIRFDDHGYDAVQSLAAAGIIQNSWREIQKGV